MSFASETDALHDEVFATFGVQGTLTTREGAMIDTLVILDEVTRNVGPLADVIDARPSVTLRIAEVGRSPRGEIALGARRFEIDRRLDGENDAYLVRVYVRELATP